MRRVDVATKGKSKSSNAASISDNTTNEEDPKSSSPQYDISVRSIDTREVTWYRTERLVSNIGADAARGRGTRVWEVRKLDKKGKPIGGPRVLKDCWIDHDRKREGTILAEIRASAKTDAQKDALKEFFLTVECHGDVYIDNKSDNTHTLIRRDKPIPHDLGVYRLQLPSPESGIDDQLLPVGSRPPVPQVADCEDTIDYDIKSHYRIVFEELGVLIDKLNSTFQIFKCLALAVFGSCSSSHCELPLTDLTRFESLT